MKQDSLLFSHDPALYQDPVTKEYFLYCTGAKIFRSKDLQNWIKVSYPATRVPAKASAWTSSEGIWAPDIYKEGDEYRLYCSNSSWGVQQSCIFLAVSDRPEGPFSPRGLVLKSNDQLKVNAIDAGLISDHETGNLYMVYGSFWGGIHLIELDRSTGLAKSDSPVTCANEGGTPVENQDFTVGTGICLARRPKWMDCAIEGPYIIFNPDTQYYYLFVSYGSLKSDYNIRVGRSKKVTGPYLDHHGKALTDLEDTDATTGYMIACGYEFTTGAFMGPGHNSVLHDLDGNWYLASHIRPRNFFEEVPSTTHIRSLYWTNDGWPVVSPQPFGKEVLVAPKKSTDLNPQVDQYAQEMLLKAVVGTYERVRLSPTLPQGIQSYVKLAINADGTGMLADSIHVNWHITKDLHLQISYGSHLEDFLILHVPSIQGQTVGEPSICLTGTDDQHICIWAIRHT